MSRANHETRPLSVRFRLREATAEQHEALHHHPLFSQLTAKDLHPCELLVVNLANLRLFQSIEAVRARQDVFKELSLAPQIAALSDDVGVCRTIGISLELNCHASVLGALYVAHGAAFGAKVIAKNLATSLPDARSSYYQMNSAKVWPDVCEALEALNPSDVEAAIGAANAVFDVLSRAVSQRVV